MQTCVNSGSSDDSDVSPDVEVILEQSDYPGLQGFAGLWIFYCDSVQDQVVLLVLLKLIHFFLKIEHKLLAGHI